MATFDHPSGLLSGIAYPPRQKREPRIDSQIGTLAAREKKQHRLASTQQLAEEDKIFYQVESGVRRNLFAAAGSVTLQIVVLATLIVAPLLFTEILPKREVLTQLYLQPPAAAGLSAPTLRVPTSTPTPTGISISRPRYETQESAPTTPPVPVTSAVGIVGGVPGGIVGGAPMGVLSEVLGRTRSVPVPTKASDVVPPKRIRVAAKVVEANLIHDVAPQYPPEAGRARIEGAVVLLAVIGTDGSVKDVRVESGLPILAQAAIDAVKQWQYKPYMIDGKPVEVDSRITINFTLAAS